MKPKRLFIIACYTVAIIGMLYRSLGCTHFTAHDPANQKQIDNLTRIDAAEKLYVVTEREVTAAFRAGQISASLDAKLISDLQTVARPAIAAAKSAMIDGDYTAAIAKAESALNGVQATLTATTKPTH